jgi:hypothetical protein
MFMKPRNWHGSVCGVRGAAHLVARYRGDDSVVEHVGVDLVASRNIRHALYAAHHTHHTNHAHYAAHSIHCILNATHVNSAV